MKTKKRKWIYFIITTIILVLVNLYVYNERIRYEYWDTQDLLFFLGIINASVLSVLGLIYSGIEYAKMENRKDFLTKYLIERYYMENKKIDVNDKVAVADTISNLQYEVEDLRDLTDLLRVSIKNMTAYKDEPIGITDTEGSIYPIGNSLTELTRIISNRLDEVSKTLCNVYQGYIDEDEETEEDKDNGKKTKPQTK